MIDSGARSHLEADPEKKPSGSLSIPFKFDNEIVAELKGPLCYAICNGKFIVIMSLRGGRSPRRSNPNLDDISLASSLELNLSGKNTRNW